MCTSALRRFSPYWGDSTRVEAREAAEAWLAMVPDDWLTRLKSVGWRRSSKQAGRYL